MTINQLFFALAGMLVTVAGLAMTKENLRVWKKRRAACDSICTEPGWQNSYGMPAIKLIGAEGYETPFDGQYVVEYDPARDGVSPDGDQMLCHLVTTRRSSE